MLETYAAWTEGAKESDLELMRLAMLANPEKGVEIDAEKAVISSEKTPLKSREFGSSLAVANALFTKPVY